MKAYQDITDRIIERLEEGDLVWSKPVKGITAFPRNFNSGRRYSGANLIMTLFSGFESPYWNTYGRKNKKTGQFNGWLAVNRQVRAGERGTPVIGWKFDEEEYTNKKGEKKTRTKPKAFGWIVFNFDQTEQVEGAEIHPKVAKIIAAQEQQPEFIVQEQPENVLAAWEQVVPNVEHNSSRMYYDMVTDKTYFPPRKSLRTEDEYYLYRFHEGVHSTGPSHRLGRFDESVGNAFGSESYSKEELVAQLGAAMLAAETGVKDFIEPSAAYIKGWIEKFQDDKTLFVSAAQKAAKAVAMILEAEAKAEEPQDAAPQRTVVTASPSRIPRLAA